MKNVTLLSSSISLMLCTQAFAQITITKDNFMPMNFGRDTFIIAAESPEVPAEGADQTWNYGNLTPSGFVYFTDYQDGSNDNTLDDDVYMIKSNFAFQSFRYPGALHYGLDENGYYPMGISNEKGAFSITAISGGPSDSLIFPADAASYESRVDDLKFPATFKAAWEGEYTQKYNFVLSVAAFGLSNVPGQDIRVIGESREVVGYGSLVAPAGIDKPSAKMDVIMVKVETSTIDNYYLGGQPAPPSLLAAFGLTQGATSSEMYYEFFRADYDKSIMRIYVVDGQVDEVRFRFSAARGLSTSINNKIENTQVSAYPNPVSVGGVITISANENNGGTSYLQIMDASGKVVANQSNLTAGINGFQFQVPADFTSGMYFYNIVSGDGAQKTTGRFQVR